MPENIGGKLEDTVIRRKGKKREDIRNWIHRKGNNNKIGKEIREGGEEKTCDNRFDIFVLNKRANIIF